MWQFTIYAPRVLLGILGRLVGWSVGRLVGWSGCAAQFIPRISVLDYEMNSHKYLEKEQYLKYLRVLRVIEQQVVTLQVFESRWTEVCGGTGSQRMQQRKMAPVLKITIDLGPVYMEVGYPR